MTKRYNCIFNFFTFLKKIFDKRFYFKDFIVLLLLYANREKDLCHLKGFQNSIDLMQMLKKSKFSFILKSNQFSRSNLISKSIFIYKQILFKYFHIKILSYGTIKLSSCIYNITHISHLIKTINRYCST